MPGIIVNRIMSTYSKYYKYKKQLNKFEEASRDGRAKQYINKNSRDNNG